MIDQYTMSLQHFDTSLKDESGKVWTQGGSPVISRTRSRFGGSLYLNGASWVGCPSCVWNATAPFTIEGWLNPEVISGTRVLLGQPSTAQAYTRIWFTNGTFRIDSYWSNVQYMEVYSASVFLVANEWQHLAFSYTGSAVHLFRNGLRVGCTLGANTGAVDFGTTMYLGSMENSGDFYQGYVDELRLSKGFARYTGNFKVPKVPFGTPKERISRKSLLVTPSIQQSLGVR